MGFTLMLLRLSYPNLPKYDFRIMEELLLQTFYESLLQMGKVYRLYRINLASSMKMLPRALIFYYRQSEGSCW
jgi:hypothetical protein